MRSSLRKILKGSIGRLAGVSRVLEYRFRSKMVVVAFHRVNDVLTDDDMTHSSANFQEYCEFFRSHFEVVPLSEQVAACNSGADLGGTLAITLDDGYLDNFDIAAPILRKLSLPATFFVITGFIGTQRGAPWDRDLVRQPGWMDWAQLRTLSSQGFEIGSHTHSHLDLGTADAASVRADLEMSKRQMEEQLGTPARLFAFPFGGRNNISDASRELVREAGFSCCLGCFGGANDLDTGPFHLNRISMAVGFDTPDQFGFDMVFGRGSCVAAPPLEPARTPLSTATADAQQSGRAP
jgi:peptidoglycan/xylan/chitin deacetylase (PgdA/CDA1 family)